jgi:hypothetical protein
MKKIVSILFLVALAVTMNTTNAQNVSKVSKETLLDIEQLAKDLGLDNFDFVMKIKSTNGQKEQPTVYSSDVGFPENYLENTYEMQYLTKKGVKELVRFSFDKKSQKPILLKDKQ